MMKQPVLPFPEMCFLLGKSLFATQGLDFMLVHCLTLWQNLTEAESREKLERAIDKCLGILCKELRDKNLLPDGFDGRLADFKKERNWLVHRFYSESLECIYSPTLAPQLIKRINGVYTEAMALTRAFEALLDQWCDKCGIPHQTIEDEITSRLDQINSQQ